MNRAPAAILVGAMAAALAAAAAAPAQAAPKTWTIVIDSLAFKPAPTSVHVGDTIVWVNKDVLRHSATAADKRFDVDLPPGKSGRTVMSKAGTVAYVCKFHPGMTGKIVVAP
jgi:plastocyanin